MSTEMCTDKPWLVQGQKVWIAVLTPLIVVALVVPLVAILFSGKLTDKYSN